jgi:hypothetical protein
MAHRGRVRQGTLMQHKSSAGRKSKSTVWVIAVVAPMLGFGCSDGGSSVLVDDRDAPRPLGSTSAGPGGSGAASGSAPGEPLQGSGETVRDGDDTTAGGADGSSRVPGAGGSEGVGSTGSPSVPATSGDGVVVPLESDWVFDEAEVRTYELTLTPDDWDLLQATALDEVFVPADLTVDGNVVEQIGVRFKGSLGTLVSCFDDDGQRTCDKLSMKLKFSEYLPDQRFKGLRRLVFNSMSSDDSQLRERLSYRVFREMGIVAPRSAHARLVINGEEQGLFSLVEAVDGTFTDDHFRGGDGNLYKEIWPDTDDPEVLSQYLKTNEETADHTVMLRLNAELTAASSPDRAGVLERYFDLDTLFAHVAVEEAIRDWDGIGAFYCFDGYCENHNYYLYQHEREPRFTLIPWDFDNTFEVETPLDGIPSFFDEPGDCSELYSAVGREVRPPGCDRVFGALGEADRGRYVAQLDRLLAGPFSAAALRGWLDAWSQQIEPFVAEDAAGPGLERFVEATDDLASDLIALRQRLVEHRTEQAGLL